MNKRSTFSGGIGFVMAAAGSAVGLGNLWRFPYLAAQYGGGIFLVVYLILLFTFGFAMLMTEIALGRKTKLSSIRAYTVFSKKFAFLGYLAWLVPLLILPYYAVIGGWVLKYCLVYIKGETVAAATDTYFSSYISQTGLPLGLFIIFLLATSIIVALGVQKGVERLSKILMPVLIVIAIGISIYVLTLPNAIEGLKYYFVPDISKFSFKTIAAAAGQLFFSLSISMGIMVSYGSYVRDDVSLVKSVNQIEIFDTMIALLSGLMIIPPVVIYSGVEATASKGPGLMFMALPKVFSSMPGGRFIGILFFILVLFAALTSSISILEATTSMLMDKWKLSRKVSVVILTIFSLVVGGAVSFGFGIWSGFTIGGMDLLTFFDYITNSVLMPIVTFCTCILIGWVVGTKTLEDEIQKNGEIFRRKMIMRVMVKYVTPVMMVLILVIYNLDQFGVISL